MSLWATTSEILSKNALNELAAKPCFPCIIWLTLMSLYLLVLPLKWLLWELIFRVLRLSGLGSHSFSSSPSLIVLFRINICRYCGIFLLNLSRQLHFKATSGNYHPALPTAAFLTWAPALAWQDPDQRVLKSCFCFCTDTALGQHMKEDLTRVWRPQSRIWGSYNNYSAFKAVIYHCTQWLWPREGSQQESQLKELKL